MLTPTRAATSSYVMVASMFFEAEARRLAAFNGKRVVELLRLNRVLRWGYDLSKCLGYFRTVESATMASG
jgi:hypothetical protein